MMGEGMRIEARTGTGLRLAKGDRLRLIDIEGAQSGDLMAFRAGDIGEWLSNGRSFDYAGKIYLSTGDTLYSNRSNPMLTIVRDEVGRHDFLYAPCSREMYRTQYGLADHPNCLDNLARALAEHGVTADRVPTAFNFFMNARVERDGALVISAPTSKAGQSIELRAEMDLLVAISACSSPGCNAGATRPIGYEVL